ncbi:MAG: hypothetical protein NVS9B15_11890 [Acidobacteriaceae bacterium]
MITQGPLGHKEIALTFDAGADRGHALTILETLERYRIRATFGMTGRWAETNPDLVRRMARDRDILMNHTYDHRSFTGLSSRGLSLAQAQRVWEINRTDAVIHRLTGRSTKPFFRPPFGDYDPSTLILLPRLGYRYMVMWTVDSLGWEHLSPRAILNRCLLRATPGEIVLMHVGIESQDVSALAPLIDGLRMRGYRLVTIPELLRHT